MKWGWKKQDLCIRKSAFLMPTRLRIANITTTNRSIHLQPIVCNTNGIFVASNEYAKHKHCFGSSARKGHEGLRPYYIPRSLCSVS